MCGIFGYIGTRKDAPSIVLTGLKTLEYRGYDSWGVAVVPSSGKNSIVVKKRVGKIGSGTVTEMPESTLSIGHTRWATHGGVTEKNAHPHLDCSGSIAVIHNGIIENYEALKNPLTKTHTFISETDSEVASHSIEDRVKTMDFLSSVRQTFLSFEGENALIAIRNTDRSIVCVKKGSPLVVGFGKNEYFVASDVPALIPYTNQVYYLEDGDLAVLTDSGITIHDAKTGNEKKIAIQTVTFDTKAAEKGMYKTFMEKEMWDQEKVIKSIANLTNEENQKIHMLAESIKKSRGTYIIGCGTAGYAALSATYLFSTIAKRHINAAIASEFRYHEEFITKDSLVIALSQSGETMDLLDAVKCAKARGASIAALVNVPNSTLWRLSDVPIYTKAGPEIGVASTKDMTAKLSHLILLSGRVAGKENEIHDDLLKAGREIKTLLSSAALFQSIAKKLKKASTMFVVGRGISYPASLETALKIKEISYIHAEGLPAGELKHGPIALIEPGTPCMVFVPEDETKGVNLSSAMEMKARGGMIIGVSPTRHDVFDEYIPVSDCGTATIIPNIVSGQMLAYYLTLERGFDPDKPRNLAKSVTVK